jgi:phage protein D
MNEGYVDWPEIKINGIAMDQEAFSNAGFVEEVVVDDDLGLPATFTITLHGGESPPYRIGQTVEVMAQGFTSQGPLLTGEITTITGDYDGFGQRVHLRGYDVSHRLHRGRQTRTFVNVTDSDICRKIANDAGIAVGTVDQTDATHDHVSQANQTDWDFLKARAKAIGFLLNVDEGKLNFQRPPDSSGAPDEGNLLERTE